MKSTAVLFLGTIFLILEQISSSQKETFEHIQVQNSQHRITRQVDKVTSGENATNTDDEEEDDEYEYYDVFDDDPQGAGERGSPPPAGSRPPGPPRGKPPGQGYLTPENRRHRFAGCWMWMMIPMKPFPKPGGGAPDGGDGDPEGGDGDDGDSDYPDPDSEDYERLRRRKNRRNRLSKVRRQRKKKKKKTTKSQDPA